MKKHLSVLSLTVGVSLVAALSASAQLVAYEGFDTNMTAGTSIGNTMGGSTSFGWNGTWRNAVTATYRTTSLTYSDQLGDVLQTSGGSAVVNGGYQERTLSTSFSGGTYWISFLAQWIGPNDPNGFGNYTRQGNLGLFAGAGANGGGGTERLDVGRPNYANYGGTPYDTWTAWNANGVTGYTHPVGTPYVPTANYSLNNANGATFVLMEVVADATTGADTAYIWFNPNLNVAPSIATADVTDSGNIDLSAAFGLRFNANAASGIYTNATVQFDEIRVGLGALDVMPVVVPEPAIFALAMIGGLGLVALKRKRQ